MNSIKGYIAFKLNKSKKKIKEIMYLVIIHT